VKHKRSNRTYHLRNWSDYNKALVNRGSLTIWFADETVTAWINQAKTGRPGASQTLTDAAILCMLTLMAVYCLRLRSTQGLLHSLFQLAEIDLTVPEYTTLCRRRKVLEVVLPRQAKGRAILSFAKIPCGCKELTSAAASQHTCCHDQTLLGTHPDTSLSLQTPSRLG